MNNKIKDVEIYQATAEDLFMFFPKGPPRTAYSWVAKYKGKPVCLAGITLEKAGTLVYSEIMPDVDAPKMTVWRTAKALLECIRSVGLPMYAACQSDNFDAQAFVQRLGFTHKYPARGMEYFAWQ